MSITFEVHGEHRYTSTLVGVIDDRPLLDAYSVFLTGDEWVPGADELGDLSQADMTRVTSGALRRLAVLY